MAAASDEEVFGTRSKPCRSCTDFKTWTKIQQKAAPTVKASQEVNTASTKEEIVVTSAFGTVNTEKRKECPLDRDELGRCSWGLLHTMAGQFPEKPTPPQEEDMKQFISLFSKLYPCHECATDLRDKLQSNPPITKSKYDFSLWLCGLHNQVNKSIGKPEFDCKLLNERWIDGWKDGSCD